MIICPTRLSRCVWNQIQECRFKLRRRKLELIQAFTSLRRALLTLNNLASTLEISESHQQSNEMVIYCPLLRVQVNYDVLSRSLPLHLLIYVQYHKNKTSTSNVFCKPSPVYARTLSWRLMTPINVNCCRHISG